MRAVAADQVASGHLVRPVRTAHLDGDRGVVLAHPGDLVAAADVHAEFARAFLEHALEPWLRDPDAP